MAAFIAYVDDSGDEHSFALGVILVPMDQWLAAQDHLNTFRRALSKDTGFKMKSELKSTGLIHRKGQWRQLPNNPVRRSQVFKDALQCLAACPVQLRVFAVVVPDMRSPRLNGPAMNEAWERVFERLERFSQDQQASVLLAPDHGTPELIRKIARRRRRFAYAPSAFGGKSRRVPFEKLVDDPMHLDSRHSYFIQWADVVAYTAFREIVPRSRFPRGLWDQLGVAIHGPANELARGRARQEPLGIIVWPDRRRPGTT